MAANGYMNNPRIRPLGEKISLTKEQLKIYIKCSNDPEYFIENYIKIITIDEGLVSIKLWKFQKEIIRACHENRRLALNAARQIGKTTIIGVGYLLWYALFQHDKVVAILAQKEKTSIEILTRIKLAYTNLPRWLQQGISEWNKSSIELENGSKIISESTSSGAIRGFTIACLYLDEFGFVPNNIAHDFLTSVYPTISSGKTSKIIISSTPKGMNHWWKIVSDARSKKNEFKILEYDWKAVPTRDAAWARSQKSILGEEKFQQEHEIEFMGSAGTLISGVALKNMSFIDPIVELLEHKLKVYEKPIPGHKYVTCADTSHGKEFDYSAFLVMDVTKVPYTIAAQYKDNNISAQEYPNVIKTISGHYNNAYVLGENNDIGALMLNILCEDLEYENIFYTEDTKTNQNLTFMNSRTPGIKTTKKTKRQGCNALKTLVDNKQIEIRDFDTISELTTFVKKTNNTYAADEGAYDDLAMCLILFAWLTTQPIFKDLVDTDIRKKLFDQKEKDLMEQLPPHPMIVLADPKPQTIREDGIVWEVVQNPNASDNDLWSGYSDPADMPKGW